MKEKVEVLKALASEPRLRMLLMLKEHSQCVGAMARRLDITQPAVSQHLRILSQAGLVRSKRLGYRVHYEIDAEALERYGDVMAAIFGGWADEPQGPTSGTAGCPRELLEECQAEASTANAESTTKDRGGKVLMQLNTIRCEAVSVNTDTGICPGIAKTRQGEVHEIGVRTPESTGICCQAFVALSSMRHVMMLTDRMDWERKPYFDVTCPHGAVTFRLSRA